MRRHGSEPNEERLREPTSVLRHLATDREAVEPGRLPAVRVAQHARVERPLIPIAEAAWAASDQLLTTKIQVPLIHSTLVPRPHLIAQLNAGVERPLTLLCAPPGFGKTTLLSAWIADCRLQIADCSGMNHNLQSAIYNLQSPRVAWVSLDEADNVPERFLTYVIAALRTPTAGLGSPRELARQVGEPGAVRAEAHLGRAALELLYAPEVPPLETILTSLINDLAAAPGAVVLVLDDYHTIHNPAIHEALAFLLDHMLPQLRLVLSSRAAPPLPLARLRARGQIAELRAADLRFTPEDAAAFLNRTMGLNLAPDTIAVLAARTQGWAAGLRLAALALQGQAREYLPDRGAGFGGNHPYVLSYLAEEVLQRQPEHIQTFLLQTSILDQMCAPLCDALTDFGFGIHPYGVPDFGLGDSAIQNRVSRRGESKIQNSQEMLEYLERANLFIAPLDSNRDWYTYHPLFADFLRYHLQQTHPDWVTALHRRASLWYEQHDRQLDAVEHALAVADFERAATLIEQAVLPVLWQQLASAHIWCVADLLEQRAQTVLMRGEIATLLRWLDALPAKTRCSRPHLCLVHACLLLLAGKLEAVEARLREAERCFADEDRAARPPQSGEPATSLCRAVLVAVRAAVAAQRGDLADAIALGRQALARLPESGLLVRGLLQLNLGRIECAAGDLAAAGQTLAEAVRSSEAASTIPLLALALTHLAALRVEQGRLQEAARLYRRSLQVASWYEGQPAPVVGSAYAGLGGILCEWNDLESAQRCLETGIDISRQWDDPHGLIAGYLALARVKQAQADPDGARCCLRHAEQLVQRQDLIPIPPTGVAVNWAGLSVAQGNVEAAARWTWESAQPGVSWGQRQVLARGLIKRGKLDEALRLLDRMLDDAKAAGRTGAVIHTLILQALALQAHGRPSAASGTLKQALALAEPEGYTRLFMDEGKPMAVLLVQTLEACSEHEIAPHYRGRLLAAFHDEGQLLSPPALGEPLSRRERDILSLLARGQSNEAIAAAFCISIGTVKTHLHNLYVKLDVTSRGQAVARARELGLLADA